MKIITEYPSEQSNIGIYKVVDDSGIYWGHYQVTENWCGDRLIRKISSLEAESLDSRKYNCHFDCTGY